MKSSYISKALIISIIVLFVLAGCATTGEPAEAGAGQNPGGIQLDPAQEGYEVAVLGGGCFWSMEASFSQLKGVRDAEAGYAGGDKEDPTYEEVSSKKTGHAEVIKVVFDPDIISYQKLLEVFFYVHDPTTLDRQGNDVGEQYRSIILFTNSRQESAARDYIESLEKDRAFADPIVTQVEPLKAYYRAEDYHQEYYEKNPDQPYCSIVVGPKVDKFEDKFADILK